MTLTRAALLLNSEGKDMNGVGLRKNKSKELETVSTDNSSSCFAAKRNKEIGRAGKWHQENMEEISECSLLMGMIK